MTIPTLRKIQQNSGSTRLKSSEHFEFHNAHELREFLNQFKETDLHAVYFTGTPFDYLTLHWETEVLSDGSEVNNLRV